MVLIARAEPVDHLRDEAETAGSSGLRGLAPSIDLLLPHLAPVLLDPVARTRLVALTRALPYFAAGFFEFRLAETEPQVDFSVTLREVPSHLPPSWLETPEWQAVEALCRYRQRPDGLTDGLEFDLDADPGPIPRPRLFIAPFEWCWTSPIRPRRPAV